MVIIVVIMMIVTIMINNIHNCVFLTFSHEPVILMGRNMAESCKQQPLQNSAPNVRTLPEKPLKTLLTHQNDHRG